MNVVEHTFLSSTVVGADSQTPLASFPNITMAAVAIQITAESGTAPTLSAWLVGTLDGGVIWHPIPFDLKLKGASTGADQTADDFDRNIFDVEGDPVAQAVAIYKHLPFRDLALKYAIGGSATPTKTFSAYLVGK